jgi:hypothetical protein
MNHQQAKADLIRLQTEQINNHEELRRAVEAGDRAELIRLRKRREDLPSEIFAAKVNVRQCEIRALKKEQAEAHNRLDFCRANNKEVDSKAIAALQVLDEARTKIKQESLDSLTEIYAIEGKIQSRGMQIRRLEQELSNLLNEKA